MKKVQDEEDQAAFLAGREPQQIIPSEKVDDTGPALYSDLLNYFIAFNTLSSSRQQGFGVGSIQLSEIYAFFKIYNIDNIDDRDLYLKRIKILDNVYIDWVNEEREKDNAKNNKKR